MTMDVTPQQAVIFTDLDGTLLDHFDYSYQPAIETLTRLQKLHTPVIINSSKTLAEVKAYEDIFTTKQPVIIENGAAVYIPVGYFNHQPEDTTEINGYWVKIFSHIREYWLSLLASQLSDFVTEYTNFAKMSLEQLMALTGLNQQQAAQAQQRQFCEPVHWHGSAQRKELFINTLIDLGANVQQGGRFLHISGHCDKGQSQLWLCEQYRQQKSMPELISIALGDGANDVPMLEAANVAVQIRSPVHAFPSLKVQQCLLQTEKYGPEGWAAAIEQLIFSKAIS